jgi:FG-GAP repeat
MRCLSAVLWPLLLAAADQTPEPLLEPSYHGAAVALVGDCDLDGSSDVIVGAWWDHAKGGHGSATVFSGKTGQVLYVVRGREEGALFGLAVAGTGDADDDGASDFAVAAPFEEQRGKAVGVVRIYSGRDGRLLRELAGRDEGERFGYSVGAAGDVDADGFGDLVVGAPGARVKKDSAPGAARVYAGKGGKLLYEWFGDHDGDRFGASVDGAGDCDVDGKPDLIVGAWRGGYARVFQGRKGEVLYAIEPETPGGRFGWCVRSAGDTNQDGASDLIVGVPWGDPLGAIVYSGKKKTPVLFTLERDLKPGSEGWGYGLAVGTAGDVNADGFADVVVGDPGCPLRLGDLEGDLLPPLFARVREKAARPGRAYVYDGHKGGLLYTFEGVRPDDFFGVSVATAGDANQDGFAEVVVGAGPEAPFLARVYNGQDGTVLHELTLD